MTRKSSQSSSSWIQILAVVAVLCSTNVDAMRWGTNGARSSASQSIRNKSQHYEIDDMEEAELSNCNGGLAGLGREFNLFGNSGRGGDTNAKYSGDSGSFGSSSPSFKSSPYPKRGSRRSYRRNTSRQPTSSPSSSPYSSSSTSNKSVFTSVKEWIQSGNLPKIQCRVEPNTTLKVRKTFRPLKTVVRLGADFNTQLGVWQFKSSWEDDVIGGKLTLAGRELQFSKTWLLSVGAVEDLVTRLRMRAAVDLGTMKAYARLGFRTERLSPINVVEGFTLRKRLPLDGNDGHVKLEVKANFAFPEPEIEYSTENHRSFVGMGDIEVNIDELNLLLDY